MSNNFDRVTRVETIDHSDCPHCNGSGRVQNGNDPNRYIECGACGGNGMVGRKVILWNPNKHISLDLQDDGRTLKIFISERGDA